MAKFTRSEIRKIIGEGCTEEMESSLVALHLGVVDPLKDDVTKYKTAAEKLQEVQTELNTLKAKGGTDWEAKYNEEHTAFEQYKADQTAKETRAAKEAAAESYFTGKRITGANLKIAMRGARDEIDGLELDDKGQIKDPAKLDALVQGEFAGLVVKTREKGPGASTPPSSSSGGKMTRDEIMAIKDVGERQKAIAENLEAFGY